MKKNKENYNIWWEEDLTDEIRDMFKKKLYDLVSDCNKIQFDNSLSNEIKNLKNTIKKLEKELLDINDETENIISKERETYENKRLKLTENNEKEKELIINNYNKRIQDIQDNLKEKEKEYENKYENFYKDKEMYLTKLINSKDNELNNSQENIKYLNSQIKQMKVVSDIPQMITNLFNNNKVKGDIGEFNDLHNLRNAFSNECIEHIPREKGLGDIYANISNIDIMIESKAYTDTSMKSSFGSVREQFIKTFIQAKLEKKRDFAILSCKNAVPKIKENNRFSWGFSNNIEMEFIDITNDDDVETELCPVFYVSNSGMNNGYNLIFTIKFAVNMYKIMKSNKVNNVSVNLRLIQKQLDRILNRHTEMRKITKKLQEDIDDSTQDLNELIKILFNNNNNNENDEEKEVKKIIKYLEKNKIHINNKNILNADNIKISGCKLNITKLKALSLKKYTRNITCICEECVKKLDKNLEKTSNSNSQYNVCLEV